MGLLSKWRILTITDEVGAFKLIRTLQNVWKPNLIVVDTETTGLNLVKDKAFMSSFAFRSGSEYVAVSIDHREIHQGVLEQVFAEVYRLTKENFLVMHNAVFDLNILENSKLEVTHTNLLDTQTLIRLCRDAVPIDRGGPPLGLKEYATRFLDTNASKLKKIIEIERTAIARNFNKQLKLSKKGLEILDTFPNDLSDLPANDRTIYEQWLDTVPTAIKTKMTSNKVETKDVPYYMVKKEILYQYAAYDAIYTHEILEELMPLVDLLDVRKILEQEVKLVYPLYKTVRQGFRLDKKYIKNCQIKLKEYIKQRQSYLKELVGEDLKYSQALKLKEHFNKVYNLDIADTGEATLTTVKNKILKDRAPLKAADIIDVVLELRTLGKWYQTYLMFFLNNDEIFYPSINPSGAVTGRFSSPFQQMPKDGIRDAEGNDLFTPRKAIIPRDNELLLFIDYSQIELRVQAMYTYLLGEPDFNLCRAYMPYKCHHYLTGEPFNPEIPEILNRWNEKQADGSSAWLTEEDDTAWIPTDLHSKTTEGAFPDIPKNTPEFKKLRGSYGKPANFACNYGAKAARIAEMFPDLTWEEAQNIYNAYRNAFPGVIKYQRWCYDQVNHLGYGTNLFERKYLNMPGHNYANAAIQGSSADFLKERMIAVYELLKDKKSKMMFTVHDEIIFRLIPEEGYLIKELVKTMEHLPKSVVPIVAESEVTDTNWAEKKGYTVDELGVVHVKGDKK